MGEKKYPRQRSFEKRIKSTLRKRRYLYKHEFIKMGVWKSPRLKEKYQKNKPQDIMETSRFLISTKNERARVAILLTLNGVSWSVASTLLHFMFPDKYPILDFRALWSLGWWNTKGKLPNYNFLFWQKYCRKIRNLSRKFNLPLRTADKALWYYSKEHQNAARRKVKS